MGRLTRALIIAGGMYAAYYIGEITGYIKGAKVIMDATNTSSKDLEKTKENIDKLDKEIECVEHFVHNQWKKDVSLEKSIGTENIKKLKELVEDNRINRLESGVDIASSNLDILRDRTEDLEERIKILDSAFNYHIMDDNRHNMYGGN